MKGENIIFTKGKKIHLEVLRIIAIIFVIFNHTKTEGFLLFTVAENSNLYWFYMFISILCKVAVPLFFMISGALLIPKEESIKQVYKKRVLRFFIVLVLFSFINYVYKVRVNGDEFSIGYFFSQLYSWKLETAYWYLYSFLGTLVMLPFIRKLALNMKSNDFIYLAICQIIIVGVVPIIEYISLKGTMTYNSNFSLGIVTSDNIFYFIMGHYFENVVSKETVTKKKLFGLFSAGFISIVISCLMTDYRAEIAGAYSESFHNGLIAIPTFCVYLGVKKMMENHSLSVFSQKIIIWAGSCTFGIMLFEGILRKRFEFLFDILVPYTKTLPASIIFVSIVIISGLIITTLLKKVYVIRKLI